MCCQPLFPLRHVVAVVVPLALVVGLATPVLGDQLKVMTYNVHHGMQQPNELTNTANIIRASGAHVIGIQEDAGAAQQLASLLGMHYTTQVDADGDGVDISILSIFPIVNKAGNGVEIALGYGRTAHVFNTHLHANPYQPYLIRDGSITNESQAITSAESARGAMLDSVLAQMADPIASGKPVFLLGDMNEPSHLDWTDEAATAGLHPFKVAYPASTSIEQAGLIDSYREAHPDPVARPGYTWTNRPGANEVHDRIDFVHYAGQGVTVANSRVVGERNAPEGGSVDIPFSGGNLPGDHRAVVSAFDLPYTIAAPYAYSIFNFTGGSFTPLAGSQGSMDYNNLSNNYTQTNTQFGTTGQGGFSSVPQLPDGPKQVMKFPGSGPAPYGNKGYRVNHNRPDNDGGSDIYLDSYTVMFDILIQDQPASGYIGLFNTNFANRNPAEVLLDFTANDGTGGFVREGSGQFALGSLQLGQWHRIALVARDSQLLDIFVDGAKVANDVPWDDSDSLYATTGPTSQGTSDFSILGDVGGLHGEGFLSSLAVFDEPLTDRTIEKLGGPKAAGIAVPGMVFKGDFNEDGVIDAADYTVWRNTYGSTTDLRADANNDTVVDEFDYTIWKQNYGARLQVGPRLVAAETRVPEPSTLGIVAVMGLIATWANLRRRATPGA